MTYPSQFSLVCNKVHSDATPFHTYSTVSYSLSLFRFFFPPTKCRISLVCFNCLAKSRLRGRRVASLIDLHISRGKAISLIKERSWTKDDPCFCGNSKKGFAPPHCLIGLLILKGGNFFPHRIYDFHRVEVLYMCEFSHTHAHRVPSETFGNGLGTDITKPNCCIHPVSL